MNRIPLWGIKCHREGFVLDNHYHIYLGQDKAGEVTVKREGLYYLFQCRCRLPSMPIYCAVLQNGNAQFNLGVCVPEGNIFRASKRIPVKLLDKQEFSFFLIEKQKNPTKVVPVDVQKPFRYLEELENAYFQRSNGTAQICIEEVKTQDPGQQGSDRNPK